MTEPKSPDNRDESRPLRGKRKGEQNPQSRERARIRLTRMSTLHQIREELRDVAIFLDSLEDSRRALERELIALSSSDQTSAISECSSQLAQIERDLKEGTLCYDSLQSKITREELHFRQQLAELHEH